MQLKTPYLVAYNAAQAIGWALCLLSLIGAYAGGPLQALGAHKFFFAKVFQGLGILETVHAIIGIVPSNPAMTLLQWAGRSNALFLILDRIPEVQSSPAGPTMLAAWAVSEIVRYPWYALSLAGQCPDFLTWLRYTLFIPAYPVGMAAEMALIYQALPYIENRSMYSFFMPNAWNMSFSYLRFCQVGLFVYVPIWWQLYSLMLRQRKKKLGGGDAKGKRE